MEGTGKKERVKVVAVCVLLVVMLSAQQLQVADAVSVFCKCYVSTTPTAGSDAPRCSYYREGGCGRRRHTNGTAVVGVGRGLLPSWSSSSWSLWIASMDWKWGDLRIPSLEIACLALDCWLLPWKSSCPSPMLYGSEFRQ